MPDEPFERELALEKIAGLTPPVFIMGGFAEELLLGQGGQRLHKDLDLLAPRAELGRLVAQLDAIGASAGDVVLADAAGRPLMLRGRVPLAGDAPAGGLELETYLARSEPDGGYSLEVPAQGPAGRLRLFLPPDTFDYPATLLAGLSIQTVSPLALALLRAASAQTRHTGDRQARDLAMVARLRQAFLAGRDDADLQPRIETVDG